MDIEIRLLRSFVAIFEAGSISRAAAKLHCTQAAMSMRLRMLEQEMGAPLFLRRHHRLEPTPSGAGLYARALGVLAAYDEMLSATRRQSGVRHVRIGVPDDYAAFVAPTLAQLGRTAEIELELVCDLSASLVASLARDELDLALATLASPPALPHDVAELPLLWVAAPSFVPDGAAIALSAYPEGCVFRRRMIEALEAAGRSWHVLVQSRSQPGVLAPVRAGIAVTAMAAGTVPADLAALATDAPLPPLGPIRVFVAGPHRSDPLLDRLRATVAAALGVTVGGASAMLMPGISNV